MATDPRLYVYRATIVSWTDGDSARIDLDKGLRDWYRGPSRIAHIDTPERDQPEAWAAARDYAAQLCPPGSSWVVRSAALDKYGRPLLEIGDPAYPQLGRGWRWFAETMIGAGHAVPYDLARQLADAAA